MENKPVPNGSNDSNEDLRGQYLEKGIDPDLIPYLLAAEEPAEEFGETETESETDEDSAQVAALLALVESSLLVGPDPELIAELTGQLQTPTSDEQDLDNDQQETLSALEFRNQVRALADALFARTPEHRFEPTLKRVRQLVDILGDPQNTYPNVHLTGTNGKTSTARMIDALLSAFDLKVGRFTSPHLREVRERISIGGEPLTHEQFLAAWEDIEPYVELVDAQSIAEGGPRLSFFEVLTVMAFAAFADYPVDVGVIECGMGGEWDATNVIDAGVVVITSIAMDHQKWLGNTVEEITTEKVGIIKDRTIVVSMRQPLEAEKIIEAKCAATDSILWLEGRDWELLDRRQLEGGQMLAVRTPAGVYADLFLPLLGEHQAHNAAAALVATEAMLGGEPMGSDLVDEGFHAIRSPGRLEIMRTSPMVVVDSAHNPAGAEALRASIEDTFGFGFSVGVFSAMADKNVEAILVEMEPILDELVLTELAGERAMPLEELTEIASDVFGEERVHPEPELVEAIDRASALADSALDPEIAKGIIVFGSVVLAGDVTALLKPDKKIG